MVALKLLLISSAALLLFLLSAVLIYNPVTKLPVQKQAPLQPERVSTVEEATQVKPPKVLKPTKTESEPPVRNWNQKKPETSTAIAVTVEKDIKEYREADKEAKLNILRSRKKDDKKTKGPPVELQSALNMELAKRLESQKAAKKLDVTTFEKEHTNQKESREKELTPFQQEWKRKLQEREERRLKQSNQM